MTLFSLSFLGFLGIGLWTIQPPGESLNLTIYLDEQARRGGLPSLAAEDFHLYLISLLWRKYQKENANFFQVLSRWEIMGLGGPGVGVQGSRFKVQSSKFKVGCSFEFQYFGWKTSSQGANVEQPPWAVSAASPQKNPWGGPPCPPIIPFSIIGFRFSVKKTRIISELKLKLVALETELGITPSPGLQTLAGRHDSGKSVNLCYNTRSDDS